MKYIHFEHCHVAGFTFWEGAFVFEKLHIGTTLTLKYEEDNRYDANAVAIYYKNTKIGYIPRTHNREIKKLLQSGHDDIFEVVINRIAPENDPEEQVGISIFLKNKK